MKKKHSQFFLISICIVFIVATFCQLLCGNDEAKQASTKHAYVKISAPELTGKPGEYEVTASAYNGNALVAINYELAPPELNIVLLGVQANLSNVPVLENKVKILVSKNLGELSSSILMFLTANKEYVVYDGETLPLFASRNEHGQLHVAYIRVGSACSYANIRKKEQSQDNDTN